MGFMVMVTLERLRAALDAFRDPPMQTWKPPVGRLGTVGVSCVWTVKEKRNGIFVPVLSTRNTFTNAGLSALASAISNQYTPPLYMVIDSDSATVQNAGGIASGVTAVTASKRVDIAGDTQLVLSPGTPNAEVVTFSSVTTSAPFIYTLSTPTGKPHSQGDTICRQVAATDTMNSVVSEVVFDAVNNPDERMQVVNGYNNGSNGNWTARWYYTGTQALVAMNTIGISENPTVGQGTLHNHFVLGYIHNAGNDVEIDGSLTLTNN